MPKAYPIYDSRYRDYLDTVRGHIDAIANLHTVGRNGMHKYNNQDHSMLTAMMAVWNMEGAAHDIWSVNTDFEYHEEQKLEETATGATLAAGPSAPARGAPSKNGNQWPGPSAPAGGSTRGAKRPSDANRG
jgi:hypothetical protein